MLTEISRLDKKLFGPLEASISDSEFWHEDNHADDIDVYNVDGEWISQTPAARLLGQKLQEFFDLISFPISIVVSMLDPLEGSNHIVGKNHTAYPDGFVPMGTMAVSKRGRFVLHLQVLSADETFDPDDVNPISISAKIG